LTRFLLNLLLENAEIVGLGDLDCEGFGWLAFEREAVDREKLRRIIEN
jgi:hypothetical protein